MKLTAKLSTPENAMRIIAESMGEPLATIYCDQTIKFDTGRDISVVELDQLRAISVVELDQLRAIAVNFNIIWVNLPKQ